MIKKPNNYDEIEVQNFDYERIELGGHKGVIIKAEEYTSPVSGKTSLKVYVDTASDDKQPNFYKKQYDNDTRIDRKWANGAIRYVPLGEEENQVRLFKGFITAYENSNNCLYDWSKDIDQLKGKKIGLVVGAEEYEKQDGDIGLARKLRDFRSIDKVDDVKIPKVKLLNNTYVDYEEYLNLKNANNSENVYVEVTDEMLPF